VSSEKKGAPQEYIETANRAIQYTGRSLDELFTGPDDLLQGELFFYQGGIQTAESSLIRSLDNARQYKRFEYIHKALFYTMRIAVVQGSHIKIKQALDEIAALLNEKEHPSRFITYDIALGWYHHILRHPEAVPAWLKGNFVPYGLATFIENFGTQIKARYHYLTKNFGPLLQYINEMKKRESVLYGRVEMLAMEACVHYKMKDKPAAFAALKVAYETASPNEIIMPFIELGKDMRTLTSAALSESACDIPKQWLETIKRKSAYYAKYQSILISEYSKNNLFDNSTLLSVREIEIVTALYHGISRTEIADKFSLSKNSVNSIMNIICKKLNANSVADVVRIAAKRKMV
jgi:LuxR family maltose regulon positive regulatory protein